MTRGPSTFCGSWHSNLIVNGLDVLSTLWLKTDILTAHFVRFVALLVWFSSRSQFSFEEIKIVELHIFLVVFRPAAYVVVACQAVVLGVLSPVGLD